MLYIIYQLVNWEYISALIIYQTNMNGEKCHITLTESTDSWIPWISATSRTIFCHALSLLALLRASLLPLWLRRTSWFPMTYNVNEVNKLEILLLVISWNTNNDLKWTYFSYNHVGDLLIYMNSLRCWITRLWSSQYILSFHTCVHESYLTRHCILYYDSSETRE